MDQNTNISIFSGATATVGTFFYNVKPLSAAQEDINNKRQSLEHILKHRLQYEDEMIDIRRGYYSASKNTFFKKLAFTSLKALGIGTLVAGTVYTLLSLLNPKAPEAGHNNAAIAPKNGE